MTIDPIPPHLLPFLNELPAEAEWVEFKGDRADPTEIGEYVSALSNGAVLAGRSHGYLVWGVDDASRKVVGTTFDPDGRVMGNQSLDNWLATQLVPQVHFRFCAGNVAGLPVVILEIGAAETSPVRFKGVSYVRIGSNKKRLVDHPAIERRLWQLLQASAPEDATELAEQSDDEVLALLDVSGYCALLGQEVPGGPTAKLELLSSERMIRADGRGRWDITRFGALSIAHELKRFDRLARKGARVIEYADQTRLRGVHEQVGIKGYAVGFQGLLAHLRRRLPSHEQIDPIRRTVETYPPAAVRELVANALIHQDLSVIGAGPMVEVFSDRIEISNPGVPLVATDRFLDTPPRSRNERLAAFMRRLGICEERGSGVDKVVFELEFAQLPAPEFRAHGESTVATVFGPRSLSGMEREARTRAVYLHTCLRYVSQQPVTNTSVRERFQVEDASRASRLLREAVEDGGIRLQDDKAGYKHRRYVPYWA
jgi:ATP-dependent DNA helicase RecG